MATEISALTPYKLGSPPDFGTLYSGRALEFDGVTDFLTVADDNNIDFIDGQAFSVSLWFKTTNATDEMYLIDKRTGGGTNAGYAALIDGNATNYLGYITDDENAATVTNETDYHDGAWHNLVFSFDGTSVISSYIDGALVGTNTQELVSCASSNDLIIGKYNGASANYFDGSMTNLQIWDKAWSLSDVQYAYTHPERLITHNSAVTSGTTISNLKAWYPCTEGSPDSPQTTVYDGSPKGLGSECIANGDFTGDVSLWNQTDAKWSIDETNDYASYADGANGYLSQTDGNNLVSIVASKIYKIQFTISDGGGNAKVHFYSASLNHHLLAEATYADGTHTVYTVSPSPYEGGFVITGKTAGNSFKITDVSVKEVQMGNHGTTTFLGNELWENSNAATFTNGSEELRTGNEIDDEALTDDKWYEITAQDGGVDFTTYGAPDNNVGTAFCLNHASPPTMDANNKVFELISKWGLHQANHAYIASDALVVKHKNYNYGGRVFLSDAAELSADLVVGRQYRLQFDIHASRSTACKVRLYDGSANNYATYTDTSPDTKTFDFTAEHATAAYFQLEFNGNGADGDTITVDNMGLKEIGVAAGWTTADAEPLIPQTALMGMSKPFYFSGAANKAGDDKVTVSNDSSMDTTGSEITVAVWVCSDDDRTGEFAGIAKRGSFYLRRESGNLFKFYVYADGGNGQVQSTTVPTGGVPYFIVGTFDGTNQSIYVNGVLETTVDDQASGTVTTGGSLIIGTYDTGGGSTQYWGGLINELSIWDESFNLAKVQELYNDGVPLDATLHSSYIADDDKLLSYYRNDGVSSWEDRSKNDNHGTPSGTLGTILLPEGTTSGKDILGFPLTTPNNGWLNFSDKSSGDSSSYVSIPHSSALNFKTNFSVAFWVKPLWTQQGYNHMIRKGNNSWEIRTQEDNIYMPEFTVWEADGTQRRSYGGALTYGVWQYLVATYNGAATFLYRVTDDPFTIETLTTSSAMDGNIQTNTSPIVIADSSNGGTGKQIMSIDEVKIYNKVLSPAEIKKNYKHGLSKHS